MNKSVWHKWFAWYPVTVSGELVWLKRIERKQVSKHVKRESFEGTELECIVMKWVYR